MTKLKSRLCLGLLLLLIVGCSVWGLVPRWRLESGDRMVAILADFRELVPLAHAAGLPMERALAALKDRGVSGLMVSELTGDDASHGLGWAEVAVTPEGTEISLRPGAPALLSEWLRLRFAQDRDPISLPLPVNMLKTVGIVPDIEGLELAKKAGLAVYYRPAPSLGWLAGTAAELLDRVAERYPVSAFTPSGEIVSGYPDVASVWRGQTLPTAMVEFSRQLGAPALNHLMAPRLLPLHSVTNEEMMARNITRKALRERLVRAAVERSVRLLLLRAAPQNMANFTLADLEQEIGDLADDLKAHGFTLGWPEPAFNGGTWGFGLLPAWALAAVLLLTLWSYLVRMGGCPSGISSAGGLRWGWLFAGLGLSVVLGFVIARVPAAARLAGAFAAPLVVTEASLAAMEQLNPAFSCRKGCLFGLAKGFLISVAGGLAVAAFFSVPSYMLRLQTFSGVKLTLMLPPVLMLLHDLKRRVHPESLGELLSRPPLWGELLLCGVLLAGLGLMVFRSGNVTFIPGFEARTREALERWLVARPRSKEVFLGYPSLLLLGFCVQRGLLARYREVLRVGVTLGLSSVVNSFCHFHTPLYLILLREFNGLWTGVLLGLVLVVAVRWLLPPLLRAVRPLME